MIEYETANGTETKPTYNYYTLGQRKGNVRIVDCDSISTPQATNYNAADALSNVAGFLLTGNEATDCYNGNTQRRNSVKLYKEGEYNKYNAKSVVEVSHWTQNDADLNKMLDKYSGHENEYALTCGVIVAQDGKDGITKAGNGYALTVVKITQDTVYVANPWFPDNIEPIPREDFLKMATVFTATPVGTQSNVSSSISTVLKLLKTRLNGI